MKKWMIPLLILLLTLCLAACKQEGGMSGNTMEGSSQGHTHSYAESVTKKAECKSEGEKTFTCECGDSYTQVIPALEHDYAMETEEPTCTNAGYYHYTCNRCGYSYQKKYAKPQQHDYATETEEPTCTHAGFYHYTCKNCGDRSHKQYAEILPHNYAEEAVAATCTKAAYCIYTCKDCGYRCEKATGFVPGHSYVNDVCQKCGETNPYAYDLGTVIENPTEADFEIFNEMAKEMSPTKSFLAADSDLATLTYYILEDDGPGLYHMFDFAHQIQTVGGWNEETHEEESPIFDIYLAQDVDWALKAIFDRDAEHYSQTDPSAWANYYEGDYFYRFAGEHYKGNPSFWVTTFETQREKLSDGFYKITVSIAWQNEFWDEEGIEPEVETGEYIAIPMYSEDMGTYWRIVSYTSLTP